MKKRLGKATGANCVAWWKRNLVYSIYRAFDGSLDGSIGRRSNHGASPRVPEICWHCQRQYLRARTKEAEDENGDNSYLAMTRTSYSFIRNAFGMSRERREILFAWKHVCLLIISSANGTEEMYEKQEKSINETRWVRRHGENSHCLSNGRENENNAPNNVDVEHEIT